MLKIILWSVGGLLVVGVVAAVGFAAYLEMTTKEPPFTLVASDGSMEVRDYAPLVVAEVEVTGPQKEAAGDGFRLLAGYIFGGNSASDEIAMTAPVVQQPRDQQSGEGTEIAMTAPVLQQAGAGDAAWTVGFVMPEEWTLATLPAPNDPAVSLRQVPGRRMAVIRFRGVADDLLTGEKTAELQAWMASAGLTAAAEPVMAFYNPPWIPGFLRRNEVMIEIGGAS